MGTGNFTDDFKRDAVAQITERGYPSASGAGFFRNSIIGPISSSGNPPNLMREPGTISDGAARKSLSVASSQVRPLSRIAWE